MKRTSATREEQALAEVARTEVTAPTAWFLVASFALAILIVPVYQELKMRGSNQLRPDIQALLPTAKEPFPPVTALRTFEDDLEEESFLRELFLAPTQALLCRLGAGNEEVYIGRDGWLFYRADVEHITGPGFLEPATLKKRRREVADGDRAIEPDPLVGILDLHAQLEERGIQLLVVPTPVKPSVHPEFLGGSPGALDNSSMKAFGERLDDAGVPWIDLHAVYAENRGADPLYLATDTHWSPAAMQHVARAIAASASAVLADRSGGASYVQTERSIAQYGDTTRMLQLGDGQTLYPDEEAVVLEVREEGATQAARVLFLGDSFANIYSLSGMGWGKDAGLVEQLRYELQEPIDTLRINDNGSFATRQALRRELLQGNDLLAGKSLVVYQFAARELSQGDWRAIELPRATQPVLSSPGRVRAKGIVSAVAPVPRPGSVPYKDALTSIHLTEIEATPALHTDEILVFRWGMRDGVWTKAARLKTGAELELDLVPWGDVANEYGSYNRSELSDERLWELETFWAPVADPTPATALASLGEDEVHEGALGWLFFGPELRHLAAGEYWGASAQTASRAENPEWRDPLPAIVDFHEQLEASSIELWVVPVPPKAAIYPEHAGLAMPASNFSEVDRRFLEQLQQAGVRVVDLYTLFLNKKEDEDAPALYCKSDTHWSPFACELSAQVLARELKERLSDIPKRTLTRENHTIEVIGDLERRLDRPEPSREELTLALIKDERGPIQPWRKSPVLLLGDSHTLVFHSGNDLLAKGAGLPEQLAFELGFAPDLVGVRGSGSTAARISLLRRRDNLAGKRAVIWVFAARDLSQSPDGWRKVPVIRD